MTRLKYTGSKERQDHEVDKTPKFLFSTTIHKNNYLTFLTTVLLLHTDDWFWNKDKHKVHSPE